MTDLIPKQQHHLDPQAKRQMLLMAYTAIMKKLGQPTGGLKAIIDQLPAHQVDSEWESIVDGSVSKTTKVLTRGDRLDAGDIEGIKNIFQGIVGPFVTQYRGQVPKADLDWAQKEIRQFFGQLADKLDALPAKPERPALPGKRLQLKGHTMRKLSSLARVAVKPDAGTPGKPVQELLKSEDPLHTVPDDQFVYWKDVRDSYREIAEQLKPMFAGKDKISVKQLKDMIGSFEPSDPKFWISMTKWDGGQKDLRYDQIVVQLNLGPDLIAEIKKDKIAYDFFNDFFEKFAHGGHPMHNQTVAWARVYRLPDKWIIEEVQSDLFGGSTKIRDIMHGTTNEILEGFSDEEKKHLEQFWTEHLIDWDKKLVSTIISMAREAGAKDIWMFDEDYKKKYLKSESKAERTYKVIPRDFGFKRQPLEIDNQKIGAWHRVVATFRQQLTARYALR